MGTVQAQAITPLDGHVVEQDDSVGRLVSRRQNATHALLGPSR